MAPAMVFSTAAQNTATENQSTNDATDDNKNDREISLDRAKSTANDGKAQTVQSNKAKPKMLFIRHNGKVTLVHVPAATKQHPRRQCLFLTLPRELRDKIYLFAVSLSTPELHDMRCLKLPVIAMTSKQLFREVVQVWFGSLHFALYAVLQYDLPRPTGQSMRMNPAANGFVQNNPWSLACPVPRPVNLSTMTPQALAAYFTPPPRPRMWAVGPPVNWPMGVPPGTVFQTTQNFGPDPYSEAAVSHNAESDVGTISHGGRLRIHAHMASPVYGTSSHYKAMKENPAPKTFSAHELQTKTRAWLRLAGPAARTKRFQLTVFTPQLSHEGTVTVQVLARDKAKIALCFGGLLKDGVARVGAGPGVPLSATDITAFGVGKARFCDVVAAMAGLRDFDGFTVQQLEDVARCFELGLLAQN